MGLVQGPVPLYYQILEILKERIRSGAYGGEAPLPTDEALVREFGVSRQTARAAVHRLVVEGLVERFRGKGTFVRPRSIAAGDWSIESLEDLIGTSFADDYRILSARFAPARDHPRSAALFGLQPSRQLFVVQALRSSTEGPYAYSEIHFPPDIGRKLPRRLFTERPLILLVEEHCGLRAYRARQTATAVAADREAARRLGVKCGAPLLALERSYFTREGRPIETVLIRYSHHRFQHVVNFWRREDVPYVASQAARRLARTASDGAAVAPFAGRAAAVPDVPDIGKERD